MTKAIINRINQINELLPTIKNSDEYVITYAGGTFPHYIDLTKAIQVKNQFVYIFEKNQSYKYNFQKRYTTTKAHDLEALKYDLSIILRSYKAHIKNDLKTAANYA